MTVFVYKNFIFVNLLSFDTSLDFGEFNPFKSRITIVQNLVNQVIWGYLIAFVNRGYDARWVN